MPVRDAKKLNRGLAILRADGGPTVGAGHVFRCVALKQWLEVDGWNVKLAADSDTLPLLKGVVDKNDLCIVGHAEKSLPDMFTMWPGGCKLLIVDHYGIGRDFETAARGWAQRIAVIEDLPTRPHNCDILLDQNAGREEGDYDGLVSDAALRLCGSEYALLRKEFFDMRPAALNRRRQPRKLRDLRLLVAFGGGDTIAMSLAAATALVEEKFEGQLNFVFATHDARLNELSHVLRSFGARAQIYIRPPSMASQLAQADVALGAAGSGSWERACLGLPAIFVELAANQREVGKSLLSAGAAESLGHGDKVSFRGIVARINALVQTEGRYAAMSRAAARLCDGLGARRTAINIAPEQLADTTKIVFRAVRRSDCERIFEWQSKPATRRYAKNPNIPTRREHEEWFANMLIDANCVANILLAGGSAIGMVRFNRNEMENDDQTWTISILVDPDSHGLGIGTAALKVARRFLPDATLLGEVLAENVASHRAFQKAGFERRENIYVAERRPV